MYNRTTQSIIGWLTLGSFFIWILELRQGVSFLDSYWVFMLFIALLMTFAYVRYKRIMAENPQNNVSQPPKGTSKIKKSLKK